jgi:hypothetical protein
MLIFANEVKDPLPSFDAALSSDTCVLDCEGHQKGCVITGADLQLVTIPSVNVGLSCFDQLV